MMPSRGKWKWSCSDQGLVGKENVLLHVGHFHEILENGLKFYSLNFNGILHVFDRT